MLLPARFSQLALIESSSHLKGLRILAFWLRLVEDSGKIVAVVAVVAVVSLVLYVSGAAGECDIQRFPPQGRSEHEGGASPAPTIPERAWKAIRPCIEIQP
jgi:hypothetical protein